MEFKAKFFAEKLKTVNPLGTVAVATLWSPVEKVHEKLVRAGVDMAPDTSPVAVLGNLYGEGFRYLLRNLLYNPRIDTLIVFGKSLNDSRLYIPHFFQKGVEKYEEEIEYLPTENGTTPSPVKIVGTSYVMDDLVLPESFARPPEILMAEPYGEEGAEKIKEFLTNYRHRPPVAGRVLVEVPQVRVSTFPSDLSAHVVAANTPTETWKLLVHRIFRFGKRVQLRKGERIELRNLKAIVRKPGNETDETIRAAGFDPDDFRTYQKDILSSDKKNFDYTYGNRIRAHFGPDCLDGAVEQLKDEHDDRKAFLTLWDNTTDMTGAHSPCLVTLFFRKAEDSLYLTATYRTHNAAKAWLENIYGLMAIQRYAAEKTDLAIAPITVISHSITLDPMYLEKTSTIHDEIANSALFNHDPNGYFRISVDRDEIVAVHYSPKGIRLEEYRGKKPGTIKQKIYRNCAVSDINHAMYIGMELQKAYMAVLDGTGYRQDNGN